jgi:hypothetical protein
LGTLKTRKRRPFRNRTSASRRRKQK